MPMRFRRVVSDKYAILFNYMRYPQVFGDARVPG